MPKSLSSSILKTSLNVLSGFVFWPNNPGVGASGFGKNSPSVSGVIGADISKGTNPKTFVSLSLTNLLSVPEFT